MDNKQNIYLLPITLDLLCCDVTWTGSHRQRNILTLGVWRVLRLNSVFGKTIFKNTIVPIPVDQFGSHQKLMLISCDTFLKYA